MKINLAQLDPDAVKVVQRLRRFDHQAYLVGGCVRDLLLGRKPKDFDVSTSATPQELRRLFRNCRIIGRRFRLAHIFFGSKVIETATFRANPREGDDEEQGDVDPVNTNGAAAPAPAASGEPVDLLIRRDNVFGTAEQDARRRDFTINGLFLDVDTGEVIDYVEGSPDIEARLVRTIGDPDIRFREDPVRILRAVKFAARCDLTIEPETYRGMMEHARELEKCAQARVSEEFFRLLRAGAAKRSMQLLLELRLLKLMAPTLDVWFQQSTANAGDAVHAADPAEAVTAAPDEAVTTDPAGSEEADIRPHGIRDALWSYLAALDTTTDERGTGPTNAVILATLFTPMLRDALDPDNRTVRDVGHHVTSVMRPVLEELKVSRRDSEQARQLLLVLRYVLPSKTASKRRRPRVNNRDLQNDLAWMIRVVARAERIDLAQFPELEPEPPRQAAAPAMPHFASERSPGASGGLTPIPVLPPGLASTTRRPVFLGTGAFGPVFSGAFHTHSD